MAAAMCEHVYNSFWSERFWLGEEFKWRDLTSGDPDIYYPQVSHLNWSIVVGVVLVLLRYLWDKFLIIPLGHSLGLTEVENNTLAPCPILESYYRSSGSTPKKHDLQGLAKRSDLTPRQIERWLSRRRTQDQPSTMYRFKECSWNVLFYTLSSTYGMYILWSKPDLLQAANWAIDWPKHHVDNDHFTLYIVELSFYWSMLLAMVWNKDFGNGNKELIVHHIVTMMLFYFSWSINIVRMGSLVVLVHDIADPFMNMAKMAKYVKWDRTADAMFVVFLVVFLVSRLFIFPFWNLYGVAFELHKYATLPPAYWFFSGLLCVLQIMNIWWSYLVLKLFFLNLTRAESKGDPWEESDAEFSDSAEEESSSTPSSKLPTEKCEVMT